MTYNDISIFRQLSNKAKNLNKEIPVLFNKNSVAQYDLTLVVSDSVQSPADIFYKFYEKFLYEHNICIVGHNLTTYRDSKYLLLCDDMDNLYRFFVKTRSDYMRYRLGNVIDSESVFNSPEVSDIDPRDTYINKIKVFKRDGSEAYIDEGATVLDFAFLIHSDIGFHFDYAYIDESKTRLAAYTRVNEGDVITIVTSEEKTAKIQWFNHVSTSKAKHHLVKYFTNK